MIKYYAYYNHGGYKDFFLGTLNDEDEFKYFLPLLSVHESSLVDNPDEELQKSVERQKQLPKLYVLSDQTSGINYPEEARVMMSHSGYKLQYKRLSNMRSVFAIRDIPGTVDSYGRQTPFNVMFVGENLDDAKSLDIIAEYTRRNIQLVEDSLNSFFENDFVENGLKFKIRSMNSFIEDILTNEQALLIDDSFNKSVRLLVIPASLTLSNAFREQNISQHDVALCYDSDGVLLYKAVSPQQSSNTPKANQSQGQHPTNPSPPRQVEHGNPSLHAMLNVPKREDIEKLWNYIYKLEKRIEQLENKS